MPLFFSILHCFQCNLYLYNTQLGSSGEEYDDDHTECLLTFIAQMDPKGWIWKMFGYQQASLQKVTCCLCLYFVKHFTPNTAVEIMLTLCWYLERISARSSTSKIFSHYSCIRCYIVSSYLNKLTSCFEVLYQVDTVCKWIKSPYHTTLFESYLYSISYSAYWTFTLLTLPLLCFTCPLQAHDACARHKRLPGHREICAGEEQCSAAQCKEVKWSEERKTE